MDTTARSRSEEVAAQEAENVGGAARSGLLTPLVLGAVLVLGLHVVLSLLALYPTPHTGGDNAGYLTLAHSLVGDGSYQELWDPASPGHTKYPPGYPLLLAAAMLLGAKSWLSFKLLSVFFVAGSVLLSYLWVAERRGPVFAGLVGGVLAFSPALLWASKWILSDPMFLALTLGALVAFQRAERPAADRWWVGVGCALAIAATFTRTAGLPLILAVGGWLYLRSAWKILAAFGAAFAVPSVAWWVRSQGVGGAQYVSEFWMANPYQPDLGTVGLGGLLARIADNLQGYVLTYIPGGIAPYGGWVLVLVGIVLAGAALTGWVLRVRERLGLMELFAPAYFGLILLWPAVWAGDRFALPLLLPLLVYAGDALVQGAQRLHARGPLLLGGFVALLLVVPAAGTWRQSIDVARACSNAVRTGGPFACQSAGFQEFVSAARWLGENAPDGAAVFSRKPRMFYALSGVPSRTYPFTGAPEIFLESARDAGVSYVVLDRIDQLGTGYVGSVVTSRTRAFCSLAGVGGQNGSPRTEILGIVLDGEEEGAGIRTTPEGTLEVGIGRCSPEMIRVEPRTLPPYTSSTVPFLEAVDP